MQTEAEASFHKALAMEESGDLAGAAAEFARATLLDGSDPRYWISRGVVLTKLRHFGDAVRCLRVGVDLKPHYGEADARVFLADALWNDGQESAAEREWLVVSKMTPTYPGYDHPIDEAKRCLAQRVGGRGGAMS
jgi:tetratricopeptide (TPR) repeat protein